MLSFSLRILTNAKRRIKTGDIKRFITTSNRWHYVAKADPVNLEFLMKLLDIDECAAKNIFDDYPHLSTIPRSRITKAYTLCVENGINSTLIPIFFNILILPPYVLEQRILFFKDLGCLKILPYLILPFNLSILFSVKVYKDWKLLPAEDNVVKNILKHIPGIPSDVPELKSINDDYSISRTYKICLRHLLKWKLEFTDEQLDRKLEPGLLVSFKAVSALGKIIETLETEFGLSRKKMRNHIHLLMACSDTIPSLLEKLNEVDDVNYKMLQKAIKKYPRLLNMKYDILQERIGVLIDYGIPRSSISLCPEILSISTQTIIERIEELESMQDLRPYWFHPRILTVLLYMRRLKKRLEHLKELKYECISIHMLTIDDKLYERYIQDGMNRTKSKDLSTFLKHEFGDVELIWANLKRHPMWCQIPFKQSYESIIYLKERNYSKDDISKNIQIILYSRSQIERELDKIDEEKIDQSWQLTSSQKLAMCLYNIEKEYHFTGHGVWNCHPRKDKLLDSEKKAVSIIS